MSPINGHNEDILLICVLQLIVIVASSRVFGGLFRRIGQPLVCGEIAAGLVLGPLFLGGMFPALFHRIFDPSVPPIFSILSQIGLILLMLLIGLEFDFDHFRKNRGTALTISSAGILLPFILGFLLGRWMHSALHLSGNWINLSLFMAAAMSITAIPIASFQAARKARIWAQTGECVACDVGRHLGAFVLGDVFGPEGASSSGLLV